MPSGGAEYVAHLGANSGGANGVYWVEILGAAACGVRVRNIAARGKHRIEAAEHLIEPDLLYPLLRWSDVRALLGPCPAATSCWPKTQPREPASARR